IYHYYKGKDDLFRSTMEDWLAQQQQGIFVLPVNPVLIPEYRFKVNQEHLMDFLRFTVWEAIDAQPEYSGVGEYRRKILQSYNEDMKAKQDMGLVPKDLDPELITLAISSLTIYPLIMEHVTRLITGHAPSEPEFQEKWTTFLRLIFERIFKADTGKE
ncbi:TetR family transcriptional regulator, partial [Gordoniibacillus kamchatkensis]